MFDEEALAELVHSIREFGLMQPIVVRELPRPAAVRYQLVMGERRWRAAQQAGLTAIPAIVRETADDNLLRDALLENIHRAQLNPLEEAAAYQQLLEEFDVTHEELAGRIGRSRPVITNMIRLLRLPIPVQRRVAAGVLSAGHARALLALEAGPEAQEELAARIVAEGLSVRATEEAVTLANRATASRRHRSGASRSRCPDCRTSPNGCPRTYDTRVTVSLGKRKGKIVVEFGSVDDLQRIVGLMDPSAREVAPTSDTRPLRHCDSWARPDRSLDLGADQESASADNGFQRARPAEHRRRRILAAIGAALLSWRAAGAGPHRGKAGESSVRSHQAAAARRIRAAAQACAAMRVLGGRPGRPCGVTTLPDPEFEKEAWLSMVMLEWGSCGQVATAGADEGADGDDDEPCLGTCSTRRRAPCREPSGSPPGRSARTRCC